MKRTYLLLLPLLLLFLGAAACRDDDAVPDTTSTTSGTGTGNPTTMSTQLRIRIGSETFTATLLDNSTTTAFKAQLPLTISMVELNGNEKYYDLPQGLPTNAANPGTIQAGDLLLYGSNTLVLFYKTFSTSYRYTRMGRVDNPAGLAAALGRGNVTVTFEVQP
ncbi:cyclophilin-like fold protein [Hymenobacter volaticus]|uniref:Cyclophilin-like fold protein n=1 Tax=Hymenobacter volaticus TaxID=2932254 RepID=A0ABY4GGM1_9BACT|nr:cyclophilin-like fold protein [Hymenobacter volaticus]UOQ69946.1 cyclophilin-like fold protein [Hymenobacter volaticus]